MKPLPFVIAVGVFLALATQAFAQLAPVQTFDLGGESPARISIDETEQIVVSLPWQRRVVTLDAAGGEVASLTPSETAVPLAVAALPGGILAISDARDQAVDIYDAAGAYQNSLGAGHGEFLLVTDVAFAPTENALLAVDKKAHQIRMYSLAGTLMRTIGTPGTLDGELQFPEGLTVSDPDGVVYVTDQSNYRVQAFDLQGNWLRSIGGRGPLPGQFTCVGGVTASRFGEICVTDVAQSHVQILDGDDGTPITIAGSMQLSPGLGLLQPTDAALNFQTKTLYVASHNTSAIEVFDLTGLLATHSSVIDYLTLDPGF